MQLEHKPVYYPQAAQDSLLLSGMAYKIYVMCYHFINI